ncbi:conserved hypothetical protein [Hyella patelloides LEGE 07179]|uniref:Uncharacterized protein n=1 Tax=Hyella patelloides LEGE 07179 TaxID=945734 RepID=A0A563VNS3_9CYAN|nr:hypothetical protein [Hyella patelloides]VEP13096.1 conserved hypothetical protein [Hyella patelloides LEGE 07179]
MARSIGQIQRELDKIKETVAEAAQELETLYDKYISCLNESAQKQLVLAGYQLCTQIYPEAFVAIPLSQRQKLQQTLRQLGKQMQPLLTQKPTAEDLSQEQADLNLIAEMLKNLPLGRSDNSDQGSTKPSNSEQNRDESALDKNLESVTAIMMDEEEEDDDDDELIVEEIQEFSFEKLQSLADREPDTNKIKEIDLSNPHHLMLWQKKIENTIRKTLDDTSRKANKYLQEFSIIPGRLPSKVIDVALQAGDSHSGNGKLRKVPNILNLVIETDKGQKAKKPSSAATQISLLRLRLSEIEFADAQLSSQRNQIRTVLKKVQQLGNIYQGKQHEYAIAEADAAWRSSWYED